MNDGRVASLRSKNRRFTAIVEKTSALHCLSSLFTLELHLLTHVFKNLESFIILSLTDAAPFEHLKAPIKQSCGMTSERC